MEKRIYKIVNLILILVTIFIIGKDYYESKKELKEEDILIKTFMNETNDNFEPKEELKEQYKLVIEIPKIKLRKGLYDITSVKNDVDKNLKLIKESKMPNIKNSNLIIAGHSGNSRYSFFDSLDKLTNNDNVYIYYKGQKYVYSINKSYFVPKTGYLKINARPSINTIILVTCKKHTSKEQLIYEGILKEVISF